MAGKLTSGLVGRGLQRALVQNTPKGANKMVRERWFGSGSSFPSEKLHPVPSSATYLSSFTGQVEAFGRLSDDVAASGRSTPFAARSPKRKLRFSVAAGVVRCPSCGVMRFGECDRSVAAAALADCGVPDCPFGGGSKVAQSREEQVAPIYFAVAEQQTHMEEEGRFTEAAEERVVWKSMREERRRIRPRILGLAD